MMDPIHLLHLVLLFCCIIWCHIYLSITYNIKCTFLINYSCYCIWKWATFYSIKYNCEPYFESASTALFLKNTLYPTNIEIARHITINAFIFLCITFFIFSKQNTTFGQNNFQNYFVQKWCIYTFLKNSYNISIFI